MEKIIINIANDFSRYPAGRYESDGPYPGELFRNKLLEPAVKKGFPFTIILDGTRGYGSSFLEEAFGGLIRLGYDPNKVKALINFEASDGSLVDEINQYIDLAARVK